MSQPTAKLPWAITDHAPDYSEVYVCDANGKRIMTDIQYYPWLDLSETDWKFMIYAVNHIDRYRKALEEISEGAGSSPVHPFTEIARHALTEDNG